MNNLQAKLAWFAKRKSEIDQEARKNGGKVRRQDLWSRNYFKHPYLARATDEDFFNRLCDVFHNQVELDDQGRISMRSVLENDAWMFQRWSHLLDEHGMRGGFTGEMIGAAKAPLAKYFENDEPHGVKLFKNLANNGRPGLVKFSQREFIESMHKHGRIRIAPASAYADGSLLHAQHDLEIQREFIIPTAEMILKGYQHANIEGHVYDISQGDVRIVDTVSNYYVYCMCREIDRRLPTDFAADAALEIHDTKQFQRRFFDALRDKLKGWEFKSGKVVYYDPYTDYKRNRVLEMTKHFKFYYQKEFRLLARPKRVIAHDLEPFFIEIGSLEDISTPYFL